MNGLNASRALGAPILVDGYEVDFDEVELTFSAAPDLPRFRRGDNKVVYQTTGFPFGS